MDRLQAGKAKQKVHSKGVVEVSPKPHADVLGMLYACLAGIMLHQLASQYESRSETTAKPHCVVAPLLYSDWSIADRAAGASWDWSRDESKQGSKRAPTHRAWPVPLAPASTAFSDRSVNPTVRHLHIAP
ncbi:uncharacterized [Tachysurus ichikawai]